MADDQVSLVKSKVDIVNVVGERVTLKRAGRNMKALCPFHGEKTPSFIVTPEMQTFKCFGCGEGGDVISFIQKYEGLSFPEALKHLADKAGVTLKTEFRTGTDKKKDDWLQIMHTAAEFYHYLLTEHRVGKSAREYLKDRKVSTSLIKEFMLGYAPDNWEAGQKYLVQKKGYSVKDLEALGLVISRQRGGGHYDRFRGRVVFPLRDFAGRVVGFSGRLLATHAKEAKYINSPETKLYKKRHLLYGLYESKKSIRENDQIVLVEGELDVLSSHRAKIRQIAAIKGSALTEEQVLLIRRLTNNIVLALDADEAGQEALKRGITTAEKHGMNLRVVVIDGGKDPDDIVMADPKHWRDLIKNSVSVYRYYIDWATSQFDISSGTGIKKVSQAVAPILAKIENSVERAYYVRLLSEKLSVREDVIEEEIYKARAKIQTDSKQESKPAPEKRDRKERLERYLISIMLHQKSKLNQNLNSIDPNIFSHTYTQRLVKALKDLAQKHSRLTIENMRHSLSPEMLGLVQELFTLDSKLINQEERELDKLYQKSEDSLKKIWAKSRLSQLSHQLSQEELGEDEKRQLYQEYQALTSDPGLKAKGEL
jgi:DNA primase